MTIFMLQALACFEAKDYYDACEKLEEYFRDRSNLKDSQLQALEGSYISVRHPETSTETGERLWRVIIDEEVSEAIVEDMECKEVAKFSLS